MKVDPVRPNVLAVTATRQEMGALVAAARMAVDVMRADPNAPAEALAVIEGVLADWDAAVAREGREPAGGPPEDAAPGPSRPAG
jgi:hypothetical protein